MDNNSNLRGPQAAPAAKTYMAARPIPNPPEPAAKVQIAKADKHGKKAKQDREDRVELAAARGAWQVQLGSYRDRKLAQVELAKLNRKYGAELKASHGRVDKSAGNFRVRFAGLSADRAKEACEAIKARGAGCLALAPS